MSHLLCKNGLISLVDYILIECQAAKRQKLEGGSLHKVCKFDYSTSSCDYLITEEVIVMFVSVRVLGYKAEIEH